MCSECHFYRCPDSCPGVVGDKSDECRSCGSAVRCGEEYVEDGGEIVCENCANEMELDEILRICEVSSVTELLREMGLTRHVI